MAKVLKTAAIVAGVVALAATGAGLVGVGAIAGIGAMSSIAAAASAVSALASAGAGALQKKPPAQGSLSETLIGINLPTPCVIGRTYAGGNQVQDVGYGGTVGGVPNPYRTLVYEWSIGPCQAVEPLADFAPIGSYYTGWLTSSSQLGLCPQSTALAGPYGTIPGWGASHKMSGHAATLFSAKFDKAGKMFASGLPRFGAIVTGPRAYDPRQDSTFPGGSGSCRPGDETTWAGGATAENPGCAGVSYALGRHQNGKLVFGPGYAFDGIDWPAWVAFMNVCDLNGWKAGGAIYEGFGISNWGNLKQICQAGGGTPVMSGGLLSVTFRAVRVALDTIEADDLADGEIILPGGRSWQQRVNTFVARYRSEAHNWEYVQADEVSVSSYVEADGERKLREDQFNLVQQRDQAAQLAAYELVDAREIGPITVALKPRLLRYRIGDALNIGATMASTVALPAGQLVLITGREPDPVTGKVTFTFETETTEKHDFALGRSSTAPPVPTLATGEEMDAVSGRDASGRFRGEWTPDTAYAVDDLFVHGGATYRVTTAHTSVEGDEPPNDNVEALPGGAAAALSVGLTNESHDVPAEADGTVLSYDGAGGQVWVFLGTTDSTEDCTFAIPSGGNPQGLTGPFSGSPLNAATGAYQVTGGLGAGEDSATLTIRATHTPSGATIDKVFSLGKSLGGATAKLLKLVATHQQFKFDGAGAVQAQTTTFTAAGQNLSGGTNIQWTVAKADGTVVLGSAGTGYTSILNYFTTATTAGSATLTADNFALFCSIYSTTGMIVRAFAVDGSVTVDDIVSVTKVSDGAAGATGATGAAGAAGLSIAELSIFKRASSAPSTPSGGSYDFATKVLTPPSGWTTVPGSGDDPLYEARGTASVQGLTGTGTPAWFGVGLIATNGQSGSSTDVIFRRSATQPSTPADSSGVPSGWYSDVASVPASSNPMWSSFGTRANPAANWVWNVPVKVEGQDGAAGAAGATGATGAHGGFGWTGIANGIVDGNTLRRSAATSNYDAAAVGPAFQAGLFVQQKNAQTSIWQMLALDNDATSYDYTQQTYLLQVLGQAYQLYVNGSLALNSSNSALLSSKNIRLETNRAVVRCFADNVEVFAYANKLTAGASLFPKVIAYGHTATITELNAGPIGAAAIIGENVIDSGGVPIERVDVITDESPLLEHIGGDGRVSNPAGFYDPALLIGITSTTTLSPSYTANGSNWTVNLPAHYRKIPGASGPVSLYYGAGSGVVAADTFWLAYILDPDLTGNASPTIHFTTNPDDLVRLDAYRVSSGRSPSVGTPDPPPPGGGGGGGGYRDPEQL